MAGLSEEEKLKILKDILGYFHRESEKQILFKCPKCDHHKRKLSVNTEKGFFKCWVCDWSGRNLYKIIRSFGNYKQKQEWRKLNQQVEINDFADKLFGKQNSAEETQKVDLPLSYISLANTSLPRNALPALNYLESRGISREDILKWKIGFCPTGEYASRIVVPSFDNDGDINYYIGRSYSNTWPKYINPNIKKNIIFNELYLDFTEEITIVEGVFDAMKAGFNSVPLLGSTLTYNSKIFKKIIENDTKVYLALDADVQKKIDNIIKLFLKYGIELYNIDVAPYNDVGEMTNGEFINRKESASLLTLDNYLINRIRGI